MVRIKGPRKIHRYSAEFKLKTLGCRLHLLLQLRDRLRGRLRIPARAAEQESRPDSASGYPLVHRGVAVTAHELDSGESSSLLNSCQSTPLVSCEL